MANNTLISSDSFGSGLAAGWTALPSLSVCQVVGGFSEANAVDVTAGQYWTGDAYPSDQICELTVHALTSEAGSALGLRVRYDIATNSGYLAFLNASTLIVYKITAGTPAQIGTTVTSLTIAAGDVWAFAATGSCLFVYQNWRPVYFIKDATFTGGTVGYQQLATTNINHCQVASFRGYSREQQDGIWAKKATILPPSAADVTGIVGAATILQGTGTILSGTCYKLWSTGGNILTNASVIAYAESYDGLTWTRGANQLAGYQEPGVWKQGSTYYLYAQSGSATGTGNLFAFTSTDGVTWGAGTDTGIGLGAGGAWDSVFIYNMLPIDYIAGTFYALYGAGDNATTFLFSMGLATSTDGIHWTKHVGNPVQVGIQPAATIKIGSTYYMFATSTQTGQSTSLADVNPAETVMWTSPDLITWTKGCFSYHHSNIDENVNGVVGQGNISAILGVGNKTIAYVVASPDDATALIYFQLAVAVANMPAASLLALPRQDGTVEVASDDFTSGAGDLSANWTTPTGGTKLKIVAGPYCEPSAFNVHCVMYYSGASFSTNQYSEITIRALVGTSGGDYAFPIVRQQSGAATCYRALISSPAGTFQANTILNIYKTVAGANTIIGPTGACTPEIGDVWKLSAIDDPVTGVPVLSLYQNDALIMQVQDYGTKITGGAPGINLYGASPALPTTVLENTQISHWAGGNADAIYVISGSAGIAGATVSYTGQQAGSVTADAGGNYYLAGLAPGAYTITPTLTDFAFTPVNSAQTITTADIASVDFSASSTATNTGSPGFGINNGIVQRIAPGINN